MHNTAQADAGRGTYPIIRPENWVVSTYEGARICRLAPVLVPIHLT